MSHLADVTGRSAKETHKESQRVQSRGQLCDLTCKQLQALADATGRSPKEIQKEYDQEGDLGTVAAAARGKQKAMFKPPPLTVAGVRAQFAVALDWGMNGGHLRSMSSP